MLLLALDTSTPAATVAVHDGRRVLAEATEIGVNRHGELLTPLVAAVLRAAGGTPRDITAIGVGLGPGPFTGLRVGLATAAALADAVGVPAYGVGSLDVLAHDRGAVVAATDARRREVYWAVYDAAGTLVTGPHVGPPNDLPTDRPVVGPAVDLYPDRLVGEPAWPRAADLATLVAPRAEREEPADRLTPCYLRRPDAVPPGRPKAVLG